MKRYMDRTKALSPGLQGLCIECSAPTKSIFYSCFCIAALACLMLTGCSPQTAENADPYPDMPNDLRMMQGSWVALDTNGCMKCGALVDGYTIRLRFQDQPEMPMLKQNSSIDRLDAERKLIILNSGYAAWPYSIGTEDGQDHFELEFYNQASKEWHRLHLKRAET